MFMTPQACLEAGTEYPRYKLFVGFDVGKRFHAAHARTGSRRRVLALRVDNDEAAVDAFVARALEAAGCEPGACLVVVDQRRNIGTVVVRRALAAGCDVAYITGKREKRARELFPGVAKNDAKDAEVIAAAAAGMPQSLLPVPREDDGLEGARRLRSQLAFSVKQSTQVKNRIRAALVESNAAFERLVDFSRPWQLDVLERLGGPWQVLDAGKGRLARVARGAGEEELAGLWESLSRATSDVYRYFGHSEVRYSASTRWDKETDMAEEHRPGKQYPEQYRKETADFVLASGRSIARCAKDLGVNEKTLGGWVADRKRELGVGGTARLKPAGPGPDPELAEARRRIRELELENDFLKKAAAYFARGLQ